MALSAFNRRRSTRTSGGIGGYKKRSRACRAHPETVGASCKCGDSHQSNRRQTSIINHREGPRRQVCVNWPQPIGYMPLAIQVREIAKAGREYMLDDQGGGEQQTIATHGLHIAAAMKDTLNLAGNMLRAPWRGRGTAEFGGSSDGASPAVTRSPPTALGGTRPPWQLSSTLRYATVCPG